MAAKQLKYWLKERFNPQLGTYWVKRGQMTATAAKRCEKSVYGDNRMHSFDTEAEYLAQIAKLEKSGVSVQ